jgi:hypothetical protein
MHWAKQKCTHDGDLTRLRSTCYEGFDSTGDGAVARLAL